MSCRPDIAGFNLAKAADLLRLQALAAIAGAPQAVGVLLAMSKAFKLLDHARRRLAAAGDLGSGFQIGDRP